MKINKKIVLVTWKGEGNFGTCLQSYALYKKIKDIGFEILLLQGKPVQYTLKSWLKGILSPLGILKIKHTFSMIGKTLQEKKRNRFQNKVFDDVFLFSKRKECELIEETDCFITGSDQIWNTWYQYDPFYFLSFADNKKRIAYASSIGTSCVKEEYKDEVRSLLNKFSHIGVREQEAVTVLSELTGRDDIRQVVDPTFLLTSDDWSDMSKDAVIEIAVPERYIFCYLIGNNDWYEAQLQDVKSRMGISDVIVIPAFENPGFTVPGAVVYRDACPVEFVYLIQHAALVCTDSFHATALSINHSVSFVEFMRFKDSDEQSQNSRIYDVLGRYHLMDRIYKNDSDAWLSPVDYQPVQEKLAEDRKSSLDYLINAIEH